LRTVVNSNCHWLNDALDHERTLQICVAPNLLGTGTNTIELSVLEDAEANTLYYLPLSPASFPSLPPTVVSFLLLGRLCSLRSGKVEETEHTVWQPYNHRSFHPMSGNNPFRQLDPSNPPPSPHLNNYHLEDSPPVHALTAEPESLYDEEPNQGEGYLAPSHELRSPSTPPGRNPPDFEAMPIPVSYLPPGATQPPPFFGALGGDEPRMSFTSSSSLNDLPRPQYPYHDSDYNSVSRLRRDSHDAKSLATFDTRPDSRFAGGFGEYQDDMTGSTIMNEYQMEDFQQAHAKNALYAAPKDQKRKRARRLLIALGVLAALVAAGALGYYFLVVRKHSSGSGSSGGGGSSDGGSSSSPTSTVGHHDLVVTGGDGSTVTMDDGTTFVYNNPFGGTWYYDPNDPYNNNAQAQSYTPPLNTTFKPGTHKIYGFVPLL
jgi:hypothetical protein